MSGTWRVEAHLLEQLRRISNVRNDASFGIFWALLSPYKRLTSFQAGVQILAVKATLTVIVIAVKAQC